jgi:hypothetical protein
MTPIRNEKQEIIAYRHEQPDGQVKIRDKHGELVGWTAFGHTRAKDEMLTAVIASAVLGDDHITIDNPDCVE